MHLRGTVVTFDDMKVVQNCPCCGDRECELPPLLTPSSSPFALLMLGNVWLQSDEIADTLRSFAQLDNRKPLVAILDAAEQRVYSLPEDITDITRSDVDSLITEFKNTAGHFDTFAELPTE